jgi:[pyruvate, water dikinase]-phosphate phosphotransferase / [pyruvate, water dikinase] kinase
MSKSKRQELVIVIISGATGRTATQLVKSALAQFDDPDVRLVQKTNVRSAKAATKIVRKWADQRVVICHSLVTPKVRDAVIEEARLQDIPTVDILGRVVAMLSDHLGTQPHREPGLSYKHQKDYFDRIDAISFTLDHDDGARLDGISDADVVLVGVSRVSKSVTCFYIGYRGIRAANVPLIPGLEVPQQLLDLPQESVIGLTVNPNRLLSVREVRRQAMGNVPLEAYVDRREIRQELLFAESIMKKHRWRQIDVSYMGIEEVASRVLKMLGKS